MTITTRYHTLSLPLPSEQRPTLLVAHSVVLRDRSLMIWCGGAEELQGHLQSQSRMAAGAKAEQSDTSASLASSSSLLVEQVIAEPTQHQEPEEVAPSGLLTSEWAIAMADARAKTANATSLFRTNADLARPMAARLGESHCPTLPCLMPS
ncbi:hypothetical protein FA10DRAFT_14603 [Acaromyces ingoldii]|uniref:Uncharacterized protein n=1 Tax=Acaromyces ingoldii TaxID=215250 RepID=A0A316YVR8_9BASI|nr:hypothetical protein FA10DRAFT_14603 [Acaromyces ingoldii]PWN93136.1 hypothetical protein FA10DRAFT_14603 [Acaromyces ingoldii]